MLDRQLLSAEAVKVVALAEQFYQAIAYERAMRAVICRVLRHPEVRAVVQAIVREDIPKPAADTVRAKEMS
jgi:hypothetical protein